MTSPGHNRLSKVSHLRRHRTHRVDDGFPHFVFAGAALAGSAEVELRAVLVPDRQVHREFDQLGSLGIQ